MYQTYVPNSKKQIKITNEIPKSYSEKFDERIYSGSNV